MAKYSQSVKSYTDIHQAFEAAGRLGLVTLSFDTSPKATMWAARANKYRVILRKQNFEAGREEACEFDHLIVRRPKGTLDVVIEPRGYDFNKIVGPDGKPVELSAVTITEPVKSPHELTEAELEAKAFLDEFERGNKK